MLTIYFDGSCQPVNPGGRAGFGWIAYLDGKCIAQNHGFVGEGEAMSNNVAEYAAVLDAMRWVDVQFPRESVLFVGDSRLVVEQLSGRWKIKKGLYVSIARDAFRFALNCRDRFKFKWVAREQNTEADALSEMGSR